MIAVVLGSGGAKGAWQVGALKYLIQERGVRPAIIAGSSIGAINGAYLAQYPLSATEKSIDDLERLWLRLKPTDIRKRRWPAYVLKALSLGLLSWGVCDLASLIFYSSAYTTAPLRRLIQRNLSLHHIRMSGRVLRVGAVNLSTKKTRVWSELDDDLEDALMASSGFPLVFGPVNIGGDLYVDYAVQESTPLEDAIRAGATEIYVLSPTVHKEEVVPKDAKGIQLLEAVLSAMWAEIDRTDYVVADLYNQAISISKELGGIPASMVGKKEIPIRVLTPSVPLQPSTDFSPDRIWHDVVLGYEDAQKSEWLSR